MQQIYNANYRFAVPPRMPTVTAEEGDGFIRLSWDDVAEHGLDPVTGEDDFEGYRIYRSTDPDFRDPQVISNGTGTGPLGNGKPIAQFDLIDGRSGFSEQTVEGVAYYLGTESGLTHTWTDYSAVNGQQYYYAVTAYDFGSEAFNFYPSENAIAVSRTPRGGLVLPPNTVAVRANPRVLGYVPATAAPAARTRRPRRGHRRGRRGQLEPGPGRARLRRHLRQPRPGQPARHQLQPDRHHQRRTALRDRRRLRRPRAPARWAPGCCR